MKTKILIGVLLLSFHLKAQTPNNGTLTGSYQANTASAFSACIYSVLLNGTTDYVSPASSITMSTNSSMSIWFKAGAFDKILIGKTTSLDDYIYFPNSTTIEVDITTTARDFTVPTMSTGTWYNLIIVRNSGTTHLYLNGTESSSGGLSQSGSFIITQIGRYYDGMTAGSDAYFWNGNVAEFREWNSVINGTDISNLAAGLAPVTATDVHWKMNEGTGTTVYDSQAGGNSNNGGGSTTPSSQWTTSGNNIYNNNTGSVGIGTQNIHDANYKLFVETGIRTRKLKVDAPSVIWPDYVFDKTYKLPTLEETEAYIKLNQHLPEIPSTKEVEKNGLDLGDNQALLLKKIEELTLLLIQQNKKIGKQDIKIRQLEKKFKKS